MVKDYSNFILPDGYEKRHPHSTLKSFKATTLVQRQTFKGTPPNPEDIQLDSKCCDSHVNLPMFDTEKQARVETQ